jgi:uncharacterized protein YceH (UPF0502 family)
MRASQRLGHQRTTIISFVSCGSYFFEAPKFMNPSDEQADSVVESENSESKPPWTALTRMQRRVAGVLVEKSKTTPDIYPMTINAIKTASNQKSNRSPLMDLREDQVEETLYELRQMGAVIEVHSGGRVPKFKHVLYEWLGVEQVELGVMAELLLRGEQTLGDLRGRASRMDRIAGINELKPIVTGLVKKGLIVELTPPGRGQIVTHGLYEANELERLRTQFAGYETPTEASEVEPHCVQSDRTNALPPGPEPNADERVDQLVQDVVELKQTIEELRQQLNEIQELLK